MYRELDTNTREDLLHYFQQEDYMVIAVPKDELIRVYTLRASRTVETSRRLHDLKGDEVQLLGYSILSALLLTSLVKHATPQKVLFKIQNQCGTVVAEADGRGKVRGFLEGDPIACWDSGVLSVVKELRLGTPYTSIVPVVGRDVKEALSFYFEQSEQTKTYLNMHIQMGRDGRVEHATAYLVQILSAVSDGAVTKVEENLRDLLLRDQRPEELAISILGGMEPRLIGLKEVEYYCPCSQEIALSSLRLLSEEELTEMLQEGPAEVVCKFCKRVYRFSREQLML